MGKNLLNINLIREMISAIKYDISNCIKALSDAKVDANNKHDSNAMIRLNGIESYMTRVLGYINNLENALRRGGIL